MPLTQPHRGLSTALSEGNPLSTLYVRGRALHIDPQDLATTLPVADGGTPIEFLAAVLGDRLLTILATNPDAEEIAEYAALLYSDATGEPFPDAFDVLPEPDAELDANSDYDADPDDDTADVIDLADYGISISA